MGSRSHARACYTTGQQAPSGLGRGPHFLGEVVIQEIALATILFMVGISCASGSVVASSLVPSPPFINTVPYAVPPYATRADLVTRALKTPFLPAPAPYLPPSAVLPRLLPSSAVLPAPAFPRVVPSHALPVPVLPPRVLPSPILPHTFPPRFPSPFLPAPYYRNFYGGTPLSTSFSGPFTIPGALFPPFFYRR
ncbi:hypothetical protein J6590_087936 [Homalodisca vitripennis]|nr:hypothetical protein J6590_087936 [Homalodisca vitripennis]